VVTWFFLSVRAVLLYLNIFMHINLSINFPNCCHGKFKIYFVSFRSFDFYEQSLDMLELHKVTANYLRQLSSLNFMEPHFFCTWTVDEGQNDHFLRSTWSSIKYESKWHWPFKVKNQRQRWICNSICSNFHLAGSEMCFQMNFNTTDELSQILFCFILSLIIWEHI
jgi:hypothetical protein